MSITVAAMNEQIERIDALRGEKEALARQLKNTQEILDQAEAKMIEMLTASNLKNFRSPLGLVSISHRTSVKLPRTPEDWKLFFEHLKSEGSYDTMITVNSMKLNSYYKDGFEAARQQGADDFQIPGITEVSVQENLSFRKAT